MVMAWPVPARQRVARKNLYELFHQARFVRVIHYSCKSFYDRPEGRSPRITSIAIRRLDSGQTVSFSIHKIAEEKKVALREIEGQYDVLEKDMLSRFYDYLGTNADVRYLHWNMRDGNYGFAAIDHRSRVLEVQNIVEINDDRKSDLSRLLIDMYGKHYSSHPRIDSLLKMNKIKPLDLMTGAQEARAFDEKNYVGLHQSTLRKVDVFANIGQLANDRQLVTLTRWWQLAGGDLVSRWNWVADHSGAALFLTLVGIGISIWQVL